MRQPNKATENRPVNNRVKRTRIARLMTQTELAAAIGVKKQTISNIERGQYVELPHMETIKKLSNALQVRASYLFPILKMEPDEDAA